jgi:hypothetical protein
MMGRGLVMYASGMLLVLAAFAIVMLTLLG